jgi:hypothetical protein
MIFESTHAWLSAFQQAVEDGRMSPDDAEALARYTETVVMETAQAIDAAQGGGDLSGSPELFPQGTQPDDEAVRLNVTPAELPPPQTIAEAADQLAAELRAGRA